MKLVKLTQKSVQDLFVFLSDDKLYVQSFVKISRTFDVHVENLVQPNLLRATRILDHSHVEMLINSFVENSFGQLVIIAGCFFVTYHNLKFI